MAIKCKRAPYTSLFFIGFFSGLAEVNPTEVTAKVWENFNMTYILFLSSTSFNNFIEDENVSDSVKFYIPEFPIPIPFFLEFIKNYIVRGKSLRYSTRDH